MTLYVVEIRKRKQCIRKARYNDLKELVYMLVQLIPIGSVTTYKNIADVLAISPRLVGKILKENRKPIIIPCHRVVGVKDTGGYTFKGKRIDEIKKKLLYLEAKGNPRTIDIVSYL